MGIKMRFVTELQRRAKNSAGYTEAFLYSNGIMQNLGTLVGSSSVALGINSTGQWWDTQPIALVMLQPFFTAMA